jgi:hypothetical protein
MTSYLGRTRRTHLINLLDKTSGKDSQAAARPATLISAYMLENEVFYVR